MSLSQQDQAWLAARNATEAPVPAGCLHTLAAKQAGRQPTRTAVVCGAQRLSHAQVQARAAQVQAWLQARGVQPGQMVLVLAHRQVDLLPALLGIGRAGAIYVPLDPANPAARVHAIVDDAAPAACLVDDTLQDRLPGGLPTLTLAEIAGLNLPVADPVARDPAEPVYMIYTSGSTGQPKGVLISHRAVANVSAWVCDPDLDQGLGLSASDRLLTIASPGFDQLHKNVHAALYCGAELHLLASPVFDARAVLDGIRQQAITVLNCTPSALEALIALAEPSDFDSLRLIAFGGEPARAARLRPLIGRPGLRLSNNYGPTETTITNTCFNFEQWSEDTDTLPIGRPIRNNRLYVVDEALNLLPPGQAGELLIGGVGVGLGYHRRPEKTAASFVDNTLDDRSGRLYRTGDRVRWRADGLLEFLGRLDTQIKLNGYRMELGEIEHALARHPAIEQAVVRLWSDEGREALVAYLSGDVQGLTVAALRTFLDAHLPPYMIPTRFVAVDAFAMTANGKLDRQALPPPTRGLLRISDAHVPARSDTQRLLVRLWAEELGLAADAVGIRDGFFDLGGTSLGLTRVHAALHQAGHRLAVATLFAKPTIEGLAEVLDQPGAGPALRAAAARRRNPKGSDRIAIVGMAGRFPGADSVEALWQALVEERDCITRFTDEELRPHEPELEALRARSDFVAARGVIQGVELFDADFFGLLPKAARLLDPQHRLWLETAWSALEHAGVDPGQYAAQGRHIGVFAGVGQFQPYLMYNLVSDRAFAADLARQRLPDAALLQVSHSKDYIATRAAHAFNLTGPALSVQTACSTGLVAVHMACQSLRQGDCDAVLAGASSIATPQARGYLTQAGGMLSEDGHCHVFDAAACGTVFSSGVCALVLKRLEDAQADGDHVLAVIAGSAVNNDGADKLSFIAPNPDGQAAVIATAMAKAGVQAGDIDYVEAHGTATPLGDPIEVDGLNTAFAAMGGTDRACLIGSVKANIGHMDAAAGAGGLIKLVESIRRGIIPGTVGFSTPNPDIDFARTPFEVVARTRDWPERGGQPRRGGVSSFGVGGGNAHAVVEQAPAPAAGLAPARPRQLLVLSAKSEAALAARCTDLADWLSANPEVALVDVAWTLAMGRSAMPLRSHVVAADVPEAIAALCSAAKQAGRARPAGAGVPLAFLFPGQGAQHPGMGRVLYEQEAVYRDCVDRLAALLEPDLACDIRDVLYPEADDAAAAQALQHTGMAQPALFVTQLALARLWAAWGITPATDRPAMLGHSVGEYVAACLAGVFDEAVACRLLARRARLMANCPGGSMLAVRRPEAEVQALLSGGVELAAINGPALCVLAGPDAAIDALEQQLGDGGEEAIRLHTSHAFHTAMMEPALADFRAAVAAEDLQPPVQPLMSCLRGVELTSIDATDPAYWADQLRHTVRFSPALEALLTDDDLLLLECGPGQTLSAAVRQHRRAGQAVPCIPSQGHAAAAVPADQAMLSALGALWQAGVSVDWPRVFGLPAGGCHRRLPLPTYRFDRQRHWVDPPAWPSAAGASLPQPPSLDALPSAPTLPVATMEPDTVTDRKTRIADALVDLFLDVSGTAIDAEERHKSFPEMGMDSLLLTQVAAELAARYGVTVRFRQLLEELSSIDTLAAHLDETLPDDAFAATPDVAGPVAPSGTAAPGLAAAPGANPGPAVPGDMQALIAQQMQMLQQQLALLRGEALAAPNATPGAVAAGPTVHAQLVDGKQGRNLAETSPERFGPYKTVNKARDGGLTTGQQAALDELISRLTMRTGSSKAYAARARQHLADPRSVANFRLVWKELVYQIVCARSDGARLWDIDDNEYIDITGCFGGGFLGHRPPFVTEALERQLALGYEVGPQTPLAADAAEKLCKLVGQDRATFCNTGSEAVMAAIRCARTVTNRPKVVYFTGDYHGVFDEVLGRANLSKGALSTRPAAPGIPQDAVDNAMILDYGTDASLDLIRQHADAIAAVVVEPVQSRYPELQPSAFLKDLRALTRDKGIALVLDEVITGFRVAPGGLSQFWGIDADMTTYGKILGGGVPIGAMAGKAKWLDAIDGGPWAFGDESLPEAPVTFFAGTFVRHPFAMAAANAVLDHLIADGGAMQARLNQRVSEFATTLNAFFEAEAVPIRMRQFSSLFRIDFPKDMPFASLLWYHLLAEGVYVRDVSQNFFFSVRHSEADFDRVTAAIQAGVRWLKAQGLITTVAAVEAPATGQGLAVGESVPMTEAQQEVWLAMQVYPEAATAYNEVSFVELRGSLDQSAFLAALGTVFRRHEALHLRLDAAGQTATRVEAGEPDIRLVDASDEARPEQRAEALCEALRHHVFDLQQGPLCQFHLIKLSERHHRLVMAFHHIVCDGWSAGLLIQELATVYSARLGGGAAALKPAIPFSTYAQTMAGRSAQAKTALDYWTRQLADVPPPARLPSDKATDGQLNVRGDSLYDRLPRSLLDAVRAAAKAHKTTPYNWFFTAYASLIARLTGQRDLVIGIPVVGQALDSLNELFGHCVQFLPIRVRLAPEQTFEQTLTQVRQTLLDAYKHVDCTFGSIVAALDRRDDGQGPPLVTATFNVDPAADFVQFAGIESGWNSVAKGTVVFDLFLNLTMGRELLKVACDFNADRFDQHTIQRWLAAFVSLLEASVEQPSAAVHQLPMLRDPAQGSAWEAFNPAPLDHDRNSDMAALFRAQATRTPDATALSHDDGQWSYAELDARSDCVAAELAQQGVQPGALVAVCLPRTPALIAALLGIHKAGAGYVPLDPAYPAERLQWMRQDSGATHVLSDAAAPDCGGQRVDIDVALACTHPVPALPPDPGRPAYVIYTSGSTGQPKGVLVTQANLLAFIAWGCDTFSPEDYAGMLVSASVCFDASVGQIFPPLSCGGGLVLVDDALALLRPLPAPVTIIDLVPSTLAEVLRHTPLPDSIRVVCTGGEALTTALADQIHARSNATRVYDTYGPTEATISACFGLRAPGDAPTIGRPQPGWRVYILDEHQQPLPVGVTGEIVIGGEGVAQGYLNRPDKTAAQFLDDPFAGDGARMYRTGDLGRWRADGTISYQGRQDHQVKLRGFRIELGEVEAALSQLDAVDQAVVDVREAVPGDRQLVAWWQPAAGTAARPADLRKALRQQLPGHMVPQQFVKLDRWPTLPSGKVDRHALPDPFATVQATTAAAVDDSAGMRTLIELWTEVIGEFDPAPEQNFLDVGGHSLLAVRASQALLQRCNVDIPVRAMMLDSMGTLAMRIDTGPSAAPGDDNGHDGASEASPTKRSLAQRLGLKR